MDFKKPKISVIILSKDRARLLNKALLSVLAQSFKDFEIIVVNDGSSDNTGEILSDFKLKISNFKTITHQVSKGITLSRQEALQESSGKYIAILDDDDEWIDTDKLKKQVEFLENNPGCVLVGGGIKTINHESQIINHKFRPETDGKIRQTMLFRNSFFTSTVMFRREEAIEAGGFVKDDIDLAEDYDLWLRLGKIGEMHNFQEVFTRYALPDYNKEKIRLFLKKQLALVALYGKSYPFGWLAKAVLKARLKI